MDPMLFPDEKIPVKKSERKLDALSSQKMMCLLCFSAPAKEEIV
jgi:hypothetical protein